MTVKLTGRQLILLGYDEPEFRDGAEVVKSIVRKTGKKPQPLNHDEFARLQFDVGQLNTFGVDPGDARSAQSLAKKFDMDD